MHLKEEIATAKTGVLEYFAVKKKKKTFRKMKIHFLRERNEKVSKEISDSFTHPMIEVMDRLRYC